MTHKELILKFAYVAGFIREAEKHMAEPEDGLPEASRVLEEIKHEVLELASTRPSPK